MARSKVKSGRPKIGLALGCGGAKGLAHLGVIRVLEENKIPIDFVAGSSIGALAGAFYAAKGTVKPLADLAAKTDWKRVISLMDPAFPARGFLNGAKIEEFIDKHLGPITFSDLKIPFAAVATDLESSEEVVIRKGKVSSAVRSSISVPLVFRPTKRSKRTLVDGGLSNPVPVRVLKEMGADKVIAVNLDTIDLDGTKAGEIASNGKMNLYHIAVFSLQILRHHLARHSVSGADWVIEPPIKDAQFIIVGFDKFIGKEREKLIKAGETAAKKAVVKIKKDLGL